MSLRKAIWALPRSPRKKGKVVKSVTSTFNLKIPLKIRRQPRNEFLMINTSWLSNLSETWYYVYNIRENPVKVPGRSKWRELVRGETLWSLLWSLKNLLQIFNGYDIISRNVLVNQFSGKKKSFRQMYDSL